MWPALLTLALWLFSLGTTAQAEWIAPPLYSCYPQPSFKLCIPSLSKGNKILAVVEDEIAFRENLQRSFAIGQPVALESSQDSSLQAGERQVIADHPEKRVYDISSSFPPFIANNLNRSVGYSGPNCYNTALIASGFLPPSEILYTGLEELEFYLAHFYEEVKKGEAPRLGDIILYDAYSSKLHVSVSLGNGLIFHKKGFKRQYSYRIVSEAEPFRPDAYEPLTDGASVDETLLKRPKRIFRLKKDWSALATLEMELTPREASAIKIIEYLQTSTLSALTQRQVGSTLGHVTESLTSTLQREFAFLATSKNPKAKLANLKLAATAHQIFQVLEESYFSSPYAVYTTILSEICYHDNDYTRELVRLLFEYAEKKFTDETIDQFFLQLKAVDRSKCQLNLLNAVKKWDQNG